MTCKWIHKGVLLPYSGKSFDDRTHCLIDNKLCEGDEDTCRVMLEKDEDD